MLFSNGFHRGHHYRPAGLPRARSARGSSGLRAGPGAEPADSLQQPKQEAARSNATTVITVQDVNDPRRTKTIITLKRRGPSSSAKGAKVGQPTGAPAVPQTPSRKTEHKPSLALAASSKKQPSPVLPDSPASTLLSNWKHTGGQRPPSYHSLETPPTDGSDLSCDTAMTHVDDGLSDWGLPKVIDYHGIVDNDDADEKEGYDHGVVEPARHCALKASAFPYDEHAVASLDIPVPTAAQLRLQRFLALMYVALLLNKRHIIPSRFATSSSSNRAVAETKTRSLAFASAKQSSVFRVLPFSSWI